MAPASIEETTASYQKLQLQLQNLVGIRQQLDSQLSENEQVQTEFANLKESDRLGDDGGGDDGNQVYKLMGPVLVKVDLEEAKGNVAKRIEFIKGEIKRVEDQLKDLSTQAEQKRAQIIRLQQEMQRQQQQSQQGSQQAQSAVA